MSRNDGDIAGIKAGWTIADLVKALLAEEDQTVPVVIGSWQPHKSAYDVRPLDSLLGCYSEWLEDDDGNTVDVFMLPHGG